MLLDTNALIWYAGGDSRLSASVQRSIDRHRGKRRCHFSAVSVWEVALMVRKRRMRLDMTPVEWRHALLKEDFVEAPLDGLLAARAEDFASLHPDPADRFIAATAAGLQAKLVTSDEALLAWAGAGGIDARA